MNKVIRLTESDLHNIVREAVNRILKEDGGMVGGAAANASGFMNGANNAQTSSNANLMFRLVQFKEGRVIHQREIIQVK